MITKAEFKELCSIGKQWVKHHPKTTFVYGAGVFLFVSLFMGFIVPVMKLGSDVMSGEIENTITFDQLTGLVIILSAAVMFLINYIWVGYFIRIGNNVCEEEDKKLSANYNQTGEACKDDNKP